MPNIQNNLHYFKISKKFPEQILDDYYIFDRSHQDLDKYIGNTKEIKNILITIKTLLKNKESKSIVARYYQKLSNSLNRYSNCSEFGCFINACDSVLDKVKGDLVLLRHITERYFIRRKLNEVVPAEWIQAILDTNLSRKKGECGENKLIDILRQAEFTETNKWDVFEKTEYCIARFSKNFSTKKTRAKLKIKLATTKQNKKLDLLIKCADHIFLCEAKHLNTSGGAQDKQIAELIEILSLREKNHAIHYIVFLDGYYSNVLLSDGLGGEKIQTQRSEIVRHLKKNKNNFWVNTAGMRALIGDLIKIKPILF